MSSDDSTWGPTPDGSPQPRHVLPRAEESMPLLPQPRGAAADRVGDATIERVPVSAAQTVGEDAAPTVTTAARPAASSWGSAPTTPVPPARAAWSDPAPTPPPPAWQPSAPVPAVPLPPRQDGTRAGLLGAMIAAIVLIAGGGGFYVGWTNKADTAAALSSPTTDFSGSLPQGGGGSSSGSASGGGTSSGGSSGTGTTPGANSPAPTTQAAPTVDPQAAALDQLNTMRSESLARLPYDSRWVAQVASKSVGITDPLQTAQNGSHTFYATDILAESEAARQTVAQPDQNVYLVWGSDFGKRSQAADGSPYWITLVDAGFSGSSAVKAWCQATYSSLTPAQLADTCAPRQLTQPHS